MMNYFVSVAANFLSAKTCNMVNPNFVSYALRSFSRILSKGLVERGGRGEEEGVDDLGNGEA